VLGVVMIRDGTQADVDAVLAIWHATAEPSATDDADGVSNLMNGNSGALLVAVDEGAVIGTVIVGWDGWRGAMYRLAVLAQYRRRGIAASLLREGERRLRDKGARRLHMIVAADATAAQEFWSTAGYERTEQLRYVKNLC
jgi:ribosomal protein S18 acetylase RimI-like enzyme